ncbi:hypothetical protein BGZ95_000156 [Linnemannia exigua]|uniref:F-box domain-containing protein n=1 Tax=Linnemannia exigua TaxID=604196 RepID=A0AAD4DJF9_9FUNG|nr:hypothetical protein BGZ95_000156 [Linnemannia exigua]
MATTDNDDDDHMRQTPTQLPEILLLIGRHLSQGDLTSCIRVSHSWHYYLEPLLWSHVSIQRPTSSSSSSSSSLSSNNSISFSNDNNDNNDNNRNGFFRNINQSAYEASIIKNVRHLHSLTIEFVQNPTLLHQLVPVLHNRLSALITEDYNPTIRQILLQNAQSIQSFTCRNVNTRQRQQYSLPQPSHEATEFWKSLSSLMFLTELTLSNACIYSANLTVFWKMCGRLKVLSLESGFVCDLSPSSYLEPFKTLRRVHLHRVSEYPQRELDFIRFCPNLEHLAWRPLQLTPLNQFMFHLVTLEPDRLARITSVDFSYIDLFDKQLATVLSSGLRLVRLIAVHSPFGDFCADQVVCSMAETLEELDVRECHLLVQNPMVQLMLVVCRRLKVFRADEISVDDMNKNTWSPAARFSRPAFSSSSSSSPSGYGCGSSTVAGYTATVPAPTLAPLLSMRMLGKLMQGDWQWGCVELEELDVTFVGSIAQKHLLLNGLPLVYSQLAQLTELRRLGFGWKYHNEERRLSSSTGVTFGSVDSVVDLALPRGSPPSSASSTASSSSSSSSSYSSKASVGSETQQKSPHFRAGLRRLWKLTQLRVFDVEKIQNPNFSVSDVKWFGKRWEGLRRIQGRLSMDPGTELAIQDLVQKDFTHITHHHNN